jgi:hypothetical protein
MGAAEVAVKSTDVEGGSLASDLVSSRLQNTALELRSQKGYQGAIHGIGSALSKTKVGRKGSSAKGRGSREVEPRGEGGPDEAATFIAQTVSDLVRLARSHQLEPLGHLLRMAELEAEEYLRLRGKRKLS